MRNASNPCTAQKNSLQARVECVGKNPGEQSLCQWKPIPHRGSNHAPRMRGPGLWKYGQKEQRAIPDPLSGGNVDLWCPGGAAKIQEGGRSKTQQTPRDQGSNTEYDPLLEREPVEYI